MFSRMDYEEIKKENAGKIILPLMDLCNQVSKEMTDNAKRICMEGYFEVLYLKNVNTKILFKIQRGDGLLYISRCIVSEKKLDVDTIQLPVASSNISAATVEWNNITEVIPKSIDDFVMQLQDTVVATKDDWDKAV